MHSRSTAIAIATNADVIAKFFFFERIHLAVVIINWIEGMCILGLHPPKNDIVHWGNSAGIQCQNCYRLCQAFNSCDNGCQLCFCACQFRGRNPVIEKKSLSISEHYPKWFECSYNWRCVTHMVAFNLTYSWFFFVMSTFPMLCVCVY